MCGIAGIWHRDGRPVSRATVGAMTDALIHRGPDGAGQHLDGNIGLGHRRLKVIDLSDAAGQPIGLPDGSLHMVYNGEVHNYRELAEQLRAAGVRLRTRSDTEVVLWAYALWGEECFNRFNGMWALAFWRPAERRLLLSRDRFGIKPLLYSVRDARVAFASEAKALLAACPEERQADTLAVRDFIAGATPDSDERTFFANVRSVLPGEIVEFDVAGTASRRYWNFAAGTEAHRPGAADALRHLLEDAVRLRLRSDVPVGVALSGGLDSSAITRFAARAGGAPLECFSLRYESPRIDESRYCRMVADDPARYRMHWITPPAAELLATTTAIVWHHDAPTPIRGRYPQWHLLREAARHVTVMLDGQGADEILAGYDRFVLPYALDRLDRRLARSPPELNLLEELRRLGQVSTGIHRLLPRLVLEGLARRFRALPRGHSLAAQWRSMPSALEHHRLLGSWVDRAGERPYRSRLNNAMWAELRSAGLPEILHSEDAISMAFGLESRLPFLDHRLVEFCFSLAYDEKIRAGWTKWLLRQSMAGVLPEPVRWRRRKFGFPGDYETWLAGPQGLATVRAVLLDSRSLERGWLDRRWLVNRLGRGERRARRWTRHNLMQAWTLLTLELWFRLFLDNDESLRPGLFVRVPGGTAALDVVQPARNTAME